MSNLIPYDDVVRLVNDNESFWADMGAHTPKHSQQGQRLAAFFRDRWNPWYVRFMQITARDLNDRQQATFAAEVADGLVAMRDAAGYQYQIGSLYTPGRDIDAELEKIAADASEVAYMIALNAGEHPVRPGSSDEHGNVYARRQPIATRHR